MVSLVTVFANIELKNPVMIASSPATESLTGIIKCEQAGASAVVTKSIADYELNRACANKDSGRRVYFSSNDKQNETEYDEYSDQEKFNVRGQTFLSKEFPKTWIISTFQRETLPLESGIKLIAEAKKHVKIPIFGSVAGLSYQIDPWFSTCQALESSGADALELSLYYLPNPYRSSNKRKITDLLDFLCKNMSIPVVVKLHIDIPAYLAVDILKDSRTNGISYLDSVETPPPINVMKRGRCCHRNVKKPNLCSVFGEWQKPLTLRYTYILSKSTRQSLCAGGGLTNGFDAIELIMLGANATQFASPVMIFGYPWITETIHQMTDTLREIDYQYIGKDDETSFLEAKARVNHDRCIRREGLLLERETKCRRCLNTAICNAIIEKDGFIQIIEKLCEGCGLCVSVCPRRAIDLISMPVSPK
jgi:dihydroorotate dehydrogenase/Pyruvate/2-oxoacid:ferredoxin oxidoreductase delta subunit